jgi:hypothetical protein
MADIALTTADRVHVVGHPIEQLDLICSVDVGAGDVVAVVSSSTGASQWVKADASTGTKNRAYGVATRTQKIGLPLTAIRKGRMSGWNFTDQDYDELIYLSNTIGEMADAAGDVSVIIGRVVPAIANPTGSAADKILEIDVANV